MKCSVKYSFLYIFKYLFVEVTVVDCLAAPCDLLDAVSSVLVMWTSRHCQFIQCNKVPIKLFFLMFINAFVMKFLANVCKRLMTIVEY